MMRASDRTVHGLTSAGAEIVRYDRAGKWYIEPTVPEIRRAHVTVRSAASLAAMGTHYPGKLGGGTFDAHVRKFQETRKEGDR